MTITDQGGPSIARLTKDLVMELSDILDYPIEDYPELQRIIGAFEALAAEESTTGQALERLKAQIEAIPCCYEISGNDRYAYQFKEDTLNLITAEIRKTARGAEK